MQGACGPEAAKQVLHPAVRLAFWGHGPVPCMAPHLNSHVSQACNSSPGLSAPFQVSEGPAGHLRGAQMVESLVVVLSVKICGGCQSLPSPGPGQVTWPAAELCVRRGWASTISPCSAAAYLGCDSPATSCPFPPLVWMPLLPWNLGGWGSFSQH